MATVKGVWKLKQDLVSTKDYDDIFAVGLINGTIGGYPFDRIHIYNNTGNYLGEFLRFTNETDRPAVGIYPTTYTTGGIKRYGFVFEADGTFIAIPYDTVVEGGINEKFRTIDFGIEEQNVPDYFYEWLIANTENNREKTLITYNDVTVEMAEGTPATLICAGKKAKTDIVIIPAFPVKITYGDIIHMADEGTPATLICSGKKMKADVVITSEITTNFVLADGSMLVTSDGQIFETQ